MPTKAWNEAQECVDIVGGVYNFLGSLSPQQKFEATDESVLQLCFLRKNKGQYTLEE